MRIIHPRRTFRSSGRNPRLICEECFMLTAVMVPFVLLDGEYHLIFEKRAANIRQGGEISFPGGVFDASLDRTTRDTALRETTEELGVDRRAVRLFNSLGTLIAGNGAAIDVFPGKIRIGSLSDLSPHPDEVEAAFAVPFAYFMNTAPEKYEALVEVKSRYVDDKGNMVVSFPAEELGLPERYRDTWGRRAHQIYLYRYGGHVIWGITARIVEELKKACA